MATSVPERKRIVSDPRFSLRRPPRPVRIQAVRGNILPRLIGFHTFAFME